MIAVLMLILMAGFFALFLGIILFSEPSFDRDSCPQSAKEEAASVAVCALVIQLVAVVAVVVYLFYEQSTGEILVGCFRPQSKPP